MRSVTFDSSFGCKKPSPSSATIASRSASRRQWIDSNVGPVGMPSHAPGGSVEVDVELVLLEVLEVDDDEVLVDVVLAFDVLVVNEVDVVVGGGPSSMVTVSV